MTPIISAHGLTKRYGRTLAVDHIDLEIPPGRIVGLIGPNGAGKTSALKAILGLATYEGELSVLGKNPSTQRAALMEDVCFIADVAVLPRWIRVHQLIEVTERLHPGFSRQRCLEYLGKTKVTIGHKVKQLSKGMVAQLHLALVMAIDAKLLLLDEPTLGLDILFRKRFFEQLLNDYFDGERTIIISTHQVEEVQNILTHVIFMNRGRLVMQKPMSALDEEFVELHAVGEAAARAMEIPHIGARSILGGKAIIYEDTPRSSLSALGELRTPSVSDLFVAKIGEEHSHGQ